MSLLEVARPTPGTSVPQAPKLTLRFVRSKLDEVQIGIRHDADAREYRVNFKGGREETAYYTDDLMDAMQSGLLMAESRCIPRAKLAAEIAEFNQIG